MRALRVALQFLTRLPVAGPDDWRDDDLARAVHLFPVVGALLGLAIGGTHLAALALGLPPLAAATLGLVFVGPLLTGALHEDGLADTADGLLGGRDRAARLRIMRDSTIGAYGALALMGALLLRVALGASLAGGAALAALALAHALGRLATVVLMARLPYARDTAEGPGGPMIAHLRAWDRGRALAMGLGVTALAAPVLGWSAAVALVGSAVLLAGLARWTQRSVGGVTGDVLGAACVLVELWVLLVCCIPVLGPATG